MAASSEQPARALARAAAVGAGACFALALAAFGAALDGYHALAHPVAVLGAEGVPRAAAFNALAFVVPGALAAFVALRQRGRLPGSAPLAARLGWTLALLAALAFSAQGLFPLGVAGPDAGVSRLHGVAWGAWGIAFASAAAALSASAFRARRPWPAVGHAVAGVLVFALAWVGADLVPAPLAQRVAFACWFAWVAGAGWMDGGRRA